MKDGLASAYVRVLTSKGEVSVNVVNFAYKYSQEEDDTCQLAIEASDDLGPDGVNLPDRAEFQEGCLLTVTWGLIGENNEKTRKVVIRNIKVFYGPGKVALELFCTNRASLLRSTSSKTIHNGTVADIAQKVTDNVGINTYFVTVDDAGLQTRSTTGTPGTHPLRIYPTLPQADKSDHGIIDFAAQNDPNGPLEVVGRDNDLYIQKRNLNQKPIRSYTYGGPDGELISFVPEIKGLSRNKGSLNVNVAGMDPTTKTVFNSDFNNNNNKEAKLGSLVNIPSFLQKSPLLPNLVNANLPTTKIDKGTKIQNTDTLPANANDPVSPYFVTVTDAGAPMHNSEGQRTQQKYGPVIDYNENIQTTEPTLNDATGVGANLQADKALQQNPAEAEVVGDPNLESGKVITILNVSKKFSGNYYIIACEHVLEGTSYYKVVMKLHKNALGITGVDSPLKTPAPTDTTNKQIGADQLPETQYAVSVRDSSAPVVKIGP